MLAESQTPLPSVQWGTSSINTSLTTVDVRSYGAVGNGIHVDTDAINAAITDVSSHTQGGVVLFPRGNFYIRADLAIIAAKSNVHLQGSGKGVTQITCDDRAGVIVGGYGCINAVTAISNFSMDGITMRGYADVAKTQGSMLLVNIDVPRSGTQYNCSNIRIENSEFLWYRFIASMVKHCNGPVVYKNNHLQWGIRDGLDAWDTPDVLFEGNYGKWINDNPLSAHSIDDTAAPVRSSIIMVGNTFTESAGVSIQGAKSVTIANNVLTRMRGDAIFIAPNTGYGNTPTFALKVNNNTVTDVFLDPYTNPFLGGASYIVISGSTKASPGTANSGPTLPTFGSGAGALYTNNTSGSVTTPGGGYIDIANNTLIRTHPAQVTAYTDWGYDSTSIWVCTKPSGVITCDYNTTPIPEANLNRIGIVIEGPMRESAIRNNIISTTGIPIQFLGTSQKNGDYDGLVIQGNQLSDWPTVQAGIFWGGPATYQRISILDNTFDGDPRFVAAAHNANGTWSSATLPFGTNFSANVSGLRYERNTFRNVSNPLQGDDSTAVPAFKRGNIAYAIPVGSGCNAGNVGIYCLPKEGTDWTVIHEDSDSTSTTYGKNLTSPLESASAQPSTGTWVQGHFVRNNTPTNATLGWLRLTTGSANVTDVDWVAVSHQPVTTLFTSSGTFSKSPLSKIACFTAVGPGGGGGGGAQVTSGTAASGGAGGGGGGRAHICVPSASIGSSITVTIGTGGAGGAAAGTASTAGTVGSAGSGATSFAFGGNFAGVSAGPGGAGEGGQIAGNAGAGSGGAPKYTGGCGIANNGSGATNGASVCGSPAGNADSVAGGSGGGGGQGVNAADGTRGGYAEAGAAGGGAGGGITAAPAGKAGGGGGSNNYVGGSAGGAVGANNGTAGTAAIGNADFGGGAGGGGSNSAGNAGTGGAGGLCGGGGGGGGSVLNGSTPGTGGAGANGCGYVVEYF